MKYCTPTCLCYVSAVLCFLQTFFARNDKLSLLKFCSSSAKMFVKPALACKADPEFRIKIVIICQNQLFIQRNVRCYQLVAM